MTFNWTIFNYIINRFDISIAGESLHDFGFHLSHTLCPTLPIQEIYCKALTLLEFFRESNEKLSYLLL